MSVRNIQGQGGYRALDGSNVANKTLRMPILPAAPAIGPWVRNPAWPSVATPLANEVLALYAVFDEGTIAPNFIAFSCITSTGQYRVQLGDGTDTNVNSNTTFNATISFAALPDIGLPYRICTVRITPVTGGANINTLNLRERHSTLTAANPIANWLEIKVNLPNASVVTIAGQSNVTKAPYLENLEVTAPFSPSSGFLDTRAIGLRRCVLSMSNASNFSFSSLFSSCVVLTDVSIEITGAGRPNDTNNMFSGCRSLTSVPLFNTAAVTNMSAMFSSCSSLTSVPLFNTAAVTNMSSMFISCYALTSVPPFSTAAVTDMNNMFVNCYTLTSVPLFNTAAVTNMNSMFQSCYSLTSVPLFNTAAVTNMSSMFNSCYSLITVPLFNAPAVSNMSGMFQSCTSLRTVPPFNTSALNQTTNMFLNCLSLTTVSLFNTVSVTNMSSMFQSCQSLTSVPLFNTAAVTNMSNMFQSCSSLTSVPLFNTAAVTNMSGMFQSCQSLTSVPLFNMAAVTNMSSMFSSCSSLTSVPLFNTAAVTNMSGMFQSCTSLRTVPLFNMAAVTNMASMFSGGLSLRAIPALNFNSVSSSAALGSIFSSCVLQRIQATGARFTHAIDNNSLSGTALDEYYTGLATITGQTLTVTGNYGTATDTPSIATAKGWTVTGS